MTSVVFYRNITIRLSQTILLFRSCCFASNKVRWSSVFVSDDQRRSFIMYLLYSKSSNLIEQTSGTEKEKGERPKSPHHIRTSLRNGVISEALEIHIPTVPCNLEEGSCVCILFCCIRRTTYVGRRWQACALADVCISRKEGNATIILVLA